MAKRWKVRPARDKRYFSRTAGATRSVNLAPTPMRGGWRL